jgi:Kef-type K+ transport system membrane component KefB
MFLAGLEIDLEEMLESGRVSVLTGVNGVIVPLVLGGLTALLFGYRDNAAIFVGIILTATSVSISAQTLLELGILRSREGLALLGAAVIDDMLVILVLSMFTALAGGAAGVGTLVTVVLRMLAYLVVAIVAGFLLLPRVVDWVDRQPISAGLAALVLVTAMLFAWSAEIAGGLAAITGAFVAGLGFSRSHLRDEIARAMHTITYAFFVPIFFVSIGLHSDLHQIVGEDLFFVVALIAVALLSKVLGCGLGARLGGFTKQESLRVGIGMMSRGEVGLIVATVGVSNGFIQADLLSITTVVVFFTTLVTPPLLRMTFTGRETENA